MDLSRVAKKDPPSKGRVWLAGCGIATLLGVIFAVFVTVITFLAMHSEGACLNGDDTACKRACFGVSHDSESCKRHGDAMLAKGKRDEAEEAYKKGCDEDDHEGCCSSLKDLQSQK